MTSKMYWAMRKAHERELEKLNEKIKEISEDRYPTIEVMGVPEEGFTFGFKFINCDGEIRYTVGEEIIKGYAQLAGLIHRTEEIMLQCKNMYGNTQADKFDIWLQYVGRCIGENIASAATAMYLETANPMFDMRKVGKK